MVLLVVPNLKSQREELEQIRVPLLFHAYVRIGSLPRALVLVNFTTILALTGTDRRSVPPSCAVLFCALIEKCAVGPTAWKVNFTSPVAVDVFPLRSVTVSVIVLLAVPNLKLQVAELQIVVPLLFHTHLVIGELPCVEVDRKVTETLPLTGTVRFSVPGSFADLPCALIEKCAVGPVGWNVNFTSPLAVDVFPLRSVTVSVRVLLAVPNLKLQVAELQIVVLLLFHTHLVIGEPPCVEVDRNVTKTLPLVGTVRFSVPGSVADLFCALIEKCAVGPVGWKVNLTSPLAVDVFPLTSVTVSVMVLLAVPNLNVQLEELQIVVLLLFHTHLLIEDVP
jgi:hypothetical protein